jgi:formyl-CoA transferase
VATDPQAAAINLFPSINDEEIGDYRTVSIPMRFKTADVRPRGRSPKIGEHTRSVLSEFGFDAAAIEGLLADNVIR